MFPADALPLLDIAVILACFALLVQRLPDNLFAPSEEDTP